MANVVCTAERQVSLVATFVSVLVKSLIDALVLDHVWGVAHPGLVTGCATLLAVANVLGDTTVDSLGVRVSVVIFSVLVRVPLVDSEVGDGVDCVFAGGSRLGAHAFALEVFFASSVVPRGEDEAHFSLNNVVEGLQVVATVGFHQDLVVSLGDSRAKLPEAVVVSVSDELSPDVELLG